MAQRNPTKSNGEAVAPAERLTPQQAAACDLLASGRTLTDAAVALGVDRSTLSQWRNHHLLFQACLNQRRHELWGEMTEHLRSLAPEAVRVLHAALQAEGPECLTAAVTILKAIGLFGHVGPPHGPTEPEDIEQEQRRQALERARTALTPEDVTLAQRQRQQDRLFAELAVLQRGHGMAPTPTPMFRTVVFQKWRW